MGRSTGSSSSSAVVTPRPGFPPVAVNIIVGDVFHNLSDGVLIATAFTLCDSSLGWLVMSAVLLHELPQEMLDFAVLLRAGLSVKAALGFNLLSSLSSLLGAVIVLGAGEVDPKVQGYLIAYGSGVLLFIALAELMPMLDSADHRSSLQERLLTLATIVLGMVLLGLT